MDNLEKRVMQLSDIVAENMFEPMLDFPRNTLQSHSLWDAVEILFRNINELNDNL